MITNDNNNFISAARKDKLVVNDGVGVPRGGVTSMKIVLSVKIKLWKQGSHGDKTKFTQDL